MSVFIVSSLEAAQQLLFVVDVRRPILERIYTSDKVECGGGCCAMGIAGTLQLRPQSMIDWLIGLSVKHQPAKLPKQKGASTGSAFCIFLKNRGVAR
jgi:hypothetical protein